MSIWNDGQHSFMFQAWKGKKFAKTMLKRELRKNQLKNQMKAKSNNRRNKSLIIEIQNDCYAEYERNQKPFDSTPTVIAPK